MDILITRRDGTLEVVNQSSVQVGDAIITGRDSDGKPIVKNVIEILEQRKERGIYSDESRRRMWAKVKV